MNWVLLAVLSAVLIALAHHLGLVEKVAEVFGEICKCARCSVFWGVLAILVLEGNNLAASIAAAILLAYLTDWLGFAFIMLAKLYSRIWDKLNHRSRRSLQ